MAGVADAGLAPARSKFIVIAGFFSLEMFSIDYLGVEDNRCVSFSMSDAFPRHIIDSNYAAWEHVSYNG
jgi:hypothetical protein